MSHFVKLVRDDLNAYFGSNWKWFVVGIVVLIFWPILVFGPSLDFDPSHFTEEWVKMGTSGLILFLLIEVLSHRRERGILSRNTATFITFYYIGPLAALKLELIDLASRVNAASGYDGTPTPNLLKLWNNFEANLKLVDSAPGVDSAGAILSQVNRMNVVRTRNILTDLQNLKSKDDFNRAEYEETLRDIDTVLSGLTDLRRMAAEPMN